jgi:mannose-6-phosphate isomerase-like protein (cupin superfamily)
MSMGTAISIESVLPLLEHAPATYREFLRVPALSAGVYVLEPGAVDAQHPHSQDEIYYVISGRGRFQVGSEQKDARPGTVLYVPARVAHRFHEIAERLVLLVVFAPAESSSA